jgi:Rps23 Pro-64 3,4-dihydroxylase Tpa1-like proline 4-hydroxylase
LQGRTFIDAGAWNLRVLERRWQRSLPFRHIVMPNAVGAEDCALLTAALDEEPAERMANEIYEVNATGEQLTQPALTALREELTGEAMLTALRTLSGKRVTHVKARGYAYTSGHYLLPHADRDVDSLRRVAFVLYVAVSDDLEGGELELFHCETEMGQIIATDPAGRIAPQVGTLVLFDVSETSLHQVREVIRGTRGSISGWFY